METIWLSRLFGYVFGLFMLFAAYAAYIDDVYERKEYDSPKEMEKCNSRLRRKTFIFALVLSLILSIVLPLESGCK
ncbi:hypothetical protein CAL7716_107010 (plasmid) [Calothrix sp. PCC 7716]|nr:hypothetical protein CAL7716_107010 [Calothrix sp. PCC 7716]